MSNSEHADTPFMVRAPECDKFMTTQVNRRLRRAGVRQQMRGRQTGYTETNVGRVLPPRSPAADTLPRNSYIQAGHEEVGDRPGAR